MRTATKDVSACKPVYLDASEHANPDLYSTFYDVDLIIPTIQETRGMQNSAFL
jgi:hypothetical protein